MADPFAPSDGSGEDPDLNRNLMAFGLATMAAPQRDQFGLPTSPLTQLGQGGLAALQQGRQTQLDRSELGLRKAQTEAFQSENALKKFGMAMQIQKYNMDADYAGIPRLDPRAFGIGGGLPSQGEETPSSGASTSGVPSAGMSSSPSAGFAPTSNGNQQRVPNGSGPPVSMVQGAMPGVQNPGMGAGYAQQQGASIQQPMTVMDIPLDVRRGAVAPTPQQAAVMANYLDRTGHTEEAKALRAQALQVSPGFQFDQNYRMTATPGGPADPSYKARVAGAEAEAQVGPHVREAGGKAWAEAPAHAWVAAMAPKDLRGPGSTYINPLFGQTVQVPNEITEVNPNSGEERKRFQPLGLSVTGKGPLSIAGAQQPGGSANQAAEPLGGTPQQRGAAEPNSAPKQAGAPAEPATGYVTKLAPGQLQAIEGAAKNYQEEGRKAYESAQAIKQSLEFVKRDIQTLGPNSFVSMGSGASARAEFAKTINTAASVAGFEPIIDQNKVTAWEDFEKESTMGGIRGLSAAFGGSREAAGLVFATIKAFPHAENSYQGALFVTSAYQTAADRETDKRIFETNWLKENNGNLVGANEAFNQQFPAAAYSRRAISEFKPYDVATPEEMRRYLPGTHIKTPDGQVRVVPGPVSLSLTHAAPQQ